MISAHATTITSPADPVHAAIERHRIADEHHRRHLLDDEQRAASRDAFSAWAALLATRPNSIAGAAAFASYLGARAEDLAVSDSVAALRTLADALRAIEQPVARDADMVCAFLSACRRAGVRPLSHPTGFDDAGPAVVFIDLAPFDADAWRPMRALLERIKADAATFARLVAVLEPVTSAPPADAALCALGVELEAAWANEVAVAAATDRQDHAGAEHTPVDGAVMATSAIVDQILISPAATLAGAKVKARAALWCHSGDVVALSRQGEAMDARLAFSLTVDLLGDDPRAPARQHATAL